MYFIRRNADIRNFTTFVRLYSLARKSHYDVLKLRRNCTDKEIKEAFIQMSKEYHPDKNKDAMAQEHFVRIVEAYNILGKPSSRAQYDRTAEEYVYHTNASANVYRNYDPYSFRYNPQYGPRRESETRAREPKEEQAKSYYGMGGVKKVPNYVIIMICFGVAFIGTFMQIVIIRELYRGQRRQAQERSRFLAEELEKVRTAAAGKDNETQTRLLLEKIFTAANTTVATASLGQTFASEKKDENAESSLTEFGVSDMVDDWYYNEATKTNMKDFL